MSAAPSPVMSGPAPEVVLLRLFEHLDRHGVDGAIAAVDMVLANGQQMCVSAGGPGVQCFPAHPPFQKYEVLFSEDPPRFWHQYADDDLLIFANVPRLLITHHITRAGGIREASRTVRRAPLATSERMLLISVSGLAMARVERFLRDTEGVTLISESEPH